jgi:hypothetical protein
MWLKPVRDNHHAWLRPPSSQTTPKNFQMENIFLHSVPKNPAIFQPRVSFFTAASAAWNPIFE